MTDPRAERRRQQVREAGRRYRARSSVHREAAARWKRENADRARAHSRVHRAVERGDLIRPDVCDDCGHACQPQAHHDDYDQPLDVRWLCPPCHAVADGKTERKAA